MASYPENALFCCHYVSVDCQPSVQSNCHIYSAGKVCKTYMYTCLQKLIRSAWVDELVRNKAGIDPEDKNLLLTFKNLPSSLQVAAVQKVKQVYPEVTTETIVGICSR